MKENRSLKMCKLDLIPDAILMPGLFILLLLLLDTAHKIFIITNTYLLAIIKELLILHGVYIRPRFEEILLIYAYFLIFYFVFHVSKFRTWRLIPTIFVLITLMFATGLLI